MRALLLDADIPTPMAVTGSPFEAEFERVLIEKQAGGQAGKYVFKGTVHRATDSRIRKEFDMSDLDGTVVHVIIIQDTLNQTVHVMHRDSKTLTSLPLTESFDLNSGPAISNDDEQLGERYIEGLLCHGYRGSRGGEHVTTLWISDELGEALIEENVGGQEEDMLRLFNIRRGEPDNTLFSVPADYKPESLQFDLT